MILCAVVEADNGRRTDGVANKRRRKHHTNVHQHTVRRNAVLPFVFHKLCVIQHTDERHCDVIHKFRTAVCAGLPYCPGIKFKFCQTKRTVIGSQKIKKRDQAAYDLANHSSNRSTDQARFDHAHQYSIQQHIGKPGN